MKYRVLVILSLLLLTAGSLWAEENTDIDLVNDMKSKVMKEVGLQDLAGARNVMDEFYRANEKDLGDRAMQYYFYFYAEVLFVNQKYSEALDVLRTAMDNYTSDIEPALQSNYVLYQKYERKPKPQLDPWPVDQASCAAHKGLWIGPDQADQSGQRSAFKGVCNLPATDRGKECTDFSQCEGYCSVGKNVDRGTKTSGRCSPYLYSQDGCANVVTDQVASGQICS